MIVTLFWCAYTARARGGGGGGGGGGHPFSEGDR